MNKKILLSIISLIILGCSALSPSTPQVVFRSPRDMNLQPQDVPDLTEAPVDLPATEPLLPEAIDQDQRVYINQIQNIYIESNAIMVPEKTTRSTDDIINRVIRNRRPQIIILDQDIIQVGDNGILISVSNDCSTQYNSGYILVLIQNNMVIVVLGCGSGLTSNYVFSLKNKISAHIATPSQPSEVAVNDLLTPTPETITGPLTETPITGQPSECIQFNLTPEECGNLGLHNFTVQISVTEYCKIFDEPSKTIDERFEFHDHGLKMNNKLELIKKDANVYINEYDENAMHHVHIYTFTLTGFTHHYSYTPNDLGKTIDCYTSVYTRN